MLYVHMQCSLNPSIMTRAPGFTTKASKNMPSLGTDGQIYNIGLFRLSIAYLEAEILQNVQCSTNQHCVMITLDYFMHGPNSGYKICYHYL